MRSRTSAGDLGGHSGTLAMLLSDPIALFSSKLTLRHIQIISKPSGKDVAISMQDRRNVVYESMLRYTGQG